MVIDRINTKAKPDDYLILFGNITEGLITETKFYLSQLKAKWDVVDLKDQPLIKLEEFWKSMGARKALSLDGFIGGTIRGQKENVIISTNISNVKFWLGESHYIAIAESAAIPNGLLKEGEIYRDKVLNISLANWDFFPINIYDVPQLIDDELMFDEM